MKNNKLLGIPTVIWLLQLLYVALALGLFAILSLKLHKQVHQLAFQLEYVFIMVVINIAWRVIIKMKNPDWF